MHWHFEHNQHTQIYPNNYLFGWSLTLQYFLHVLSPENGLRLSRDLASWWHGHSQGPNHTLLQQQHQLFLLKSLMLVLNSLVKYPQSLETLLYVKESHSIRTGNNINLQNCLVKSSTSFNLLHNPFFCKNYCATFARSQIVLCAYHLPRLENVKPYSLEHLFQCWQDPRHGEVSSVFRDDIADRYLTELWLWLWFVHQIFEVRWSFGTTWHEIIFIWPICM